LPTNPVFWDIRLCVTERVVSEVSKNRNAFETPGLITQQHSQEQLSLQPSEGVRGNRTRTKLRHKRRRKKHHDLVTLTSKYEKIKSTNIFG